MIPATMNGLPAMACVSSDAKITSAAAWSVKQWSSPSNSSTPRRAFHSMVCNRLEVICHEDLDTSAAPHVGAVRRDRTGAVEKKRYSKSIGEARLMVGNAHPIMCRAPKSRAGCHFAAAIGLRSMLEDYAPTVPDWALDQHTIAGHKLGRGLDHFREHGAKLIPEPTEPDAYEDEAYRLWALKQQGNNHALTEAGCGGVTGGISCLRA